jgi:hypothetical protein
MGASMATNTPTTGGQERRAHPGPRFSRKTLALAFAVAALADGLFFFLKFIPPLEWAADLVTAIALFVILGRQWILLPGLIFEAIPGLGMVPFWVLVVAAVAVWGTPRPGKESVMATGRSLRGFFRA